jgi:hypothetical protein
MMNMMSTTGLWGIGAGVFWLHLHWFFGAFAIVGYILLTVWALKNLTGEKLKSVTVWLLAIGIIGTLLTAPLAAGGFQWMMGARHGGYGLNNGMTNNSMMMDGPMMMRMMDMMMGHDEGTEGEEHGEHEDMEEMMRKMMGPYGESEAGNRPGMMMDTTGNGMMNQ